MPHQQSYRGWWRKLQNSEQHASQGCQNHRANEDLLKGHPKLPLAHQYPARTITQGVDAHVEGI